MSEINLNQPLPAWVKDHPVILLAADKKSGGDGKYVYPRFRKDVLKIKNPLPMQISTLGQKAYRLLYGGK